MNWEKDKSPLAEGEKLQRKDNMSWYYYKNNFDLVDTLKV